MAWKVHRAASAKADSDGTATGGSVEEQRPGCLGSGVATKTARVVPSASSIHSAPLPTPAGCSCLTALLSLGLASTQEPGSGGR